MSKEDHIIDLVDSRLASRGSIISNEDTLFAIQEVVNERLQVVEFSPQSQVPERVAIHKDNTVNEDSFMNS